MSDVGPLSAYSERTLALLASLLSGAPAHVVRTSRLVEPVVVAAGPRTVFLDPTRAGLYDLVLAGRMLRRRKQVRAMCRARRSGAPPASRSRRWIAAEQAHLAKWLPGSTSLPGCRAGARPGEHPLRIVWRHVELRPLDAASCLGPERIQAVAGTSMEGVAGDMAHLVEAVRTGRMSHSPCPALPGVPVAETELHLCLPPFDPPAWERFEVRLDHVKAAAADAARCIRRHSESEMDRAASQRARPYGMTIDGSRLHDARVAQRLGRSFPVFRRRRRSSEPVFDPRDHAALLAIDLNALHAHAGLRTRLSSRPLLLILQTMIELGIPLEVTGFADRTIRLADGSKAYLHVVVPIKQADEPFDGAARGRLLAAWGMPGLPAGTPATSHAVHVRTLVRRARALEAERPARLLHCNYMAGMSADPDLRDPIVLGRATTAIDQALRRMVQEMEADVSMILLGPRALQEHGAAGGFARKIVPVDDLS